MCFNKIAASLAPSYDVTVHHRERSAAISASPSAVVHFDSSPVVFFALARDKIASAFSGHLRRKAL